MSHDYDVIIAGLGAMGGAAAYHLAKRGRRVLGLDRFHPPHQFGSSHGLTRIIREAYFEHPLYVPLVRRAYELWAELQQEFGQRLLMLTGGLMIGPPDGVLVAGARRSAEQHQLPHQLLSAPMLRARFPTFKPAEEMVAVWEPRAGILFPELAIQAHLELARQHGAVLRFNEPVLRWEPRPGGVEVRSASGPCTAAKLLVSAGAWATSLLPGLKGGLSIERQVLCWFENQSPHERARDLPIFLCEHAPGRFFYGFPDLGDGLKAAIHHEGEITSPDAVRHDVTQDESSAVKGLLDRLLPGVAGRLTSSTVCLYTNTPDHHFTLGSPAGFEQVLLVSPCSGHGFKFSPVIGEVAAALLDGRAPPFDLSLFRPDRFN